MFHNLRNYLRGPYRLIALFLALVIIVTIVAVQGFSHGRLNNFHDQSIQIPIIYSYADASLFESDFLLDARDTYVTLFYPLLGVISRAIPLKWLMAGLYAASIASTITAVYALGVTLFRRREVGLVAAVLWLAYFPNPGGDFIHSPFVTHTTFSIAIELWALVLFFRKRYGWAGLLLGIATNINAMTATFVAVMCIFALLSQPREWSLKLLRFPLFTGIAALPILIWRFSLPLSEAALGDFVDIIRLRLWYAVFPLEMSALLWIGFFAVLVLWRYSLRYGKALYHRQVIAMMLGIATLSTIGAVFSEIIPLEFIIELQLIRSTWLINLLVLFYFANMVYKQLTSRDGQQIALAFLLITFFAVPRWVIELSPPSQPTPYPLAIDLDTAWHDQYPVLVGAIVALATAGVVWSARRWLRDGSESHLAGTQVRPVLGWFGVTLIFFSLPAFINSNVPDEQLTTTADWEDTLVWVEQHTPQDAYFYIPPTLDGFRVVTKRSSLGNWKDGTVGIFHNGWAIEWRQRMYDMGFEEDDFAFAPMTQDRLCNLAAIYDLDYAVIFEKWDITGERVYQNDTFAVIPVPTLACQEMATHPAREQAASGEN